MATGGLHGELLDELGRLICSEHLPVNGFPSAEQIEKEYDVSRSVVREVFRVLEAKGLISSRPRIGVRVQAPSEWHYLDPDVVRWRAMGTHSAEQLTELTQLRLAAEPLAAGLAAAMPGAVRFPELRHAVSRMRDAAEQHSYVAFVNADREFHRALFHASGNRMLGSLATTVSVALQVRSEVVDMSEDMSADVVELHEAVLEAVEGRRPLHAEAAARAIVEASLREVEHALDRVRSR